MEYLVFKVREYMFAVKSASVCKIVQRAFTEEHYSKSWISGYIWMNGKRIEIIDLLFQLGLSMHRDKNGQCRHCFILFNYDHDNFGIMADEILGKSTIPLLKVSHFKTVYGMNDPRAISGNFSFNGKDVIVLNEEFLVPPSDIKDEDLNKSPTDFFPSYQNKAEGKNDSKILSYYGS
jgi:chemotaxis signal transduction protein